MSKPFVKSADTKTPVSQSQAALEKLLRRYGASGFGFNSDYKEHLIRVTFRVPDMPGAQTIVPVRLEISIAAIARALWPNTKDLSAYGWEQAERVAWRHLVLWVDAACSATNAGLQTMSEAFLAHALVKAPDGQIKRVIAMLDDAAGEGGWPICSPEPASSLAPGGPSAASSLLEERRHERRRAARRDRLVRGYWWGNGAVPYELSAALLKAVELHSGVGSLLDMRPFRRHRHVAARGRALEQETLL